MTTRTIARREAIGRLALGSLGVAAPVWLEALTARTRARSGLVEEYKRGRV